MAGEAWLKGTVPHAYAAQTLRTAKETIEGELKTIEEQQPEGASTPDPLLAARTRSLVQVVDLMRAAVEGRDGSNVAQLLKQLETEEQAVKLMAEGGGAQP